MYQIRKFLSSLEHHELLKLKQQVEQGNISFEKEIQQRIKQQEKQHAKFCATCSNEMDPYNANNYTILFGPEDFKKKASFCGLDCLEYFMMHLKHLKKGGANDKQLQ